MKNTLMNILRPSNEDNTVTNETSKEITTAMEENTNNTSAGKKASFENMTFKTDFARKDTNNVFTNPGKNVKLAEPKSLEDAELITAAIKEGVAILLFLDSVVEEQTASRILDFINGYCHAFNIVPQSTKQANLWLYDPNNTKQTTNFR